MLELLDEYLKKDPAATGRIEVLLLYPGIKAVALHRVAGPLHRWRIPFVPRMVSEFGRWLTGIEIHPGARIGKGLVIDHGMGVVIGETAVVGDHCLIYHGVTLGGTSLRREKRHPTIGDRVVLGAGAKVLGNIEIGHDSRIGANAVVSESLPPRSKVRAKSHSEPGPGVRPGGNLHVAATRSE